LVGETIGHEKCLTQNAVTVEMIVKYHSSQKTTDLFIAENVSKITNKVKNRFEYFSKLLYFLLTNTTKFHFWFRYL